MGEIILIICGLLLDACGAVLILKPLLNRMNKLNLDKITGAITSNYAIKFVDEDTEYRYQVNARYGLVFLLSGFVL